MTDASGHGLAGEAGAMDVHVAMPGPLPDNCPRAGIAAAEHRDPDCPAVTAAAGDSGTGAADAEARTTVRLAGRLGLGPPTLLDNALWRRRGGLPSGGLSASDSDSASSGPSDTRSNEPRPAHASARGARDATDNARGARHHRGRDSNPVSEPAPDDRDGLSSALWNTVGRLLDLHIDTDVEASDEASESSDSSSGTGTRRRRLLSQRLSRRDIDADSRSGSHSPGTSSASDPGPPSASDPDEEPEGDRRLRMRLGRSNGTRHSPNSHRTGNGRLSRHDSGRRRARASSADAAGTSSDSSSSGSRSGSRYSASRARDAEAAEAEVDSEAEMVAQFLGVRLDDASDDSHGAGAGPGTLSRSLVPSADIVNGNRGDTSVGSVASRARTFNTRRRGSDSSEGSRYRPRPARDRGSTGSPWDDENSAQTASATGPSVPGLRHRYLAGARPAATRRAALASDDLEEAASRARASQRAAEGASKAETRTFTRVLKQTLRAQVHTSGIRHTAKASRRGAGSAVQAAGRTGNDDRGGPRRDYLHDEDVLGCRARYVVLCVCMIAVWTALFSLASTAGYLSELSPGFRPRVQSAVAPWLPSSQFEYHWGDGEGADSGYESFLTWVTTDPRFGSPTPTPVIAGPPTAPGLATARLIRALGGGFGMSGNWKQVPWASNGRPNPNVTAAPMLDESVWDACTSITHRSIPEGGVPHPGPKRRGDRTGTLLGGSARASPTRTGIDHEHITAVSGRFGVPELATATRITEIGAFVPDESYATAEHDDAVVAELYQQLRVMGDSRLAVTEDHLADLHRWSERHERHADKVEVALTVPDHHPLWPMYRLYWLYDIRDCPAVTPECLVYLSPEMNRRPHLKAYRKCCVEHRRLRDLTFWTLDALAESAGRLVSVGVNDQEGSPFAHYVADGALIGMVRDGGVLVPPDTDVDMITVPGEQQRLFEALDTYGYDDASAFPVNYDYADAQVGAGSNAGPAGATRKPSKRPPHLVNAYMLWGGDDADRINVPLASPPNWRYYAGDSHVELFFARRHVSRAGWDPEAVLPLQLCAFYNRWVPCPAKPSVWLMRMYGEWYWTVRSPPIQRLFGLHWCRDPVPTDEARGETPTATDQTLLESSGSDALSDGGSLDGGGTDEQHMPPFYRGQYPLGYEYGRLGEPVPCRPGSVPV